MCLWYYKAEFNFYFINILFYERFKYSMKSVDLHVHSTYSDGTLTPSELAIHAKHMGLSAFALTDHDTIDGISEAMHAGKEQGIEVIPGVELSTSYNNKEIHIVGLFIDYNDDILKNKLNYLKNTRINRNIEMCNKFKNLGINISYEKMLEMYPDSVITRAHFADYLVKMGIIKSRTEAFERYLGDRRPCYVPRQKIQPQEAIDMIKNAGGIAILAHPILYHLGSEQMNSLVQYLCECGLTGLEAIYSTYTMGEELSMRKLANENNLLISGGSDYHGENKPHIEMGTGRGKLFVPYNILEHLKNAVHQ